MKRIPAHIFIVTFIACLSFFVLPCQASAKGDDSATQPAAIKIAVIDLARVMREAKVSVNMQKQLEDQRAKFQDEFSKLERKLMETEKKLSEESQGLSEEDADKKKQEFEKQLLDSRRLVQKRSRDLEKASSDALLELKGHIDEIVTKMAKDQNYTFVMTKQDIVYADASTDITDDVLKMLDKEIKEIKINIKPEN